MPEHAEQDEQDHCDWCDKRMQTSGSTGPVFCSVQCRHAYEQDALDASERI